jgi:hypothetical protein
LIVRASILIGFVLGVLAIALGIISSFDEGLLISGAVCFGSSTIAIVPDSKKTV